MRIILFVVFALSFIDVKGQCVDAGRDTIACGFRYVLLGEPAGGTWSYLCSDSTQWVELGGTTAQGRAISLVGACGEYTYVYSVNDTSCTGSDTVIVRYEDDSEQTRNISYDIDIQYGSHNCPGFPYDSCGHIRVFPGAPPPDPRWFITLIGNCDASYIDPIVSNIDSMSCQATFNYVSVNTLDTFSTLWTSTQTPFFQVNKLTGEIINNRFDAFMKIIEGSLMNGLDSACTMAEKCYVEDAECVETVLDSVEVIVPVHLGGRWGLVDTSGVTLLADTNDISFQGEDYRLIIATGVRNFGPGDLQFELYKRNQSTILPLDSTVDLTFFWQEEWVYDTTYRVFERLVPNGDCPNCGVHEVNYAPMVFPTIPTTFCPTISLRFNPPIELEISGDPVICEDGFTILSATLGFDRYQWSNGTMSVFNFVEEPGLLVLTATDSAGCQATASIEITETEHADYQILYDSTLFCENNCADFEVVGSGIRSFIWDNGDEDTTAKYCFSLDDDFITVELTDTSGCRFNDTIELDINPTVTISAGPDMQITCNNPTVTLRPDSARLVNAGYFIWSGPGINPGNENDLQPTVDMAGTYVLSNGMDSMGCLGRDTVIIRLFDETPDIRVSQDDLINCAQEQVTISGEILGNNNNSSFYWEGPGINASNRTDAMVTIDQPGTYIFYGCNDITGCCDQDTVAIGFNTNQPTSDAGLDKVITCDTTQVVIGGPNTSTGFDFIYEWEGPDINASNRGEIFPTVRVEGTYRLTVTDTVSQCTATDVVMVENRGNVPVSNAGMDLYITCTSPIVQLMSRGSTSGSGIGFIWEGPGITAQNERDPSPATGIPGTYVLTVRDTIGNCESSDTVRVFDETTYPEISAGGDLTIDCNIRDIRLQGQLDNDNGRMLIVWDGPGIEDFNRNTLMASINKGGTYILTVTDTLSDCISRDTVIVVEDFQPAQIDAGPDMDINCLQDEVLLTASISGFDTLNNIFFWEGPDIVFSTRDDRNQTVRTPGTYNIRVLAGNPNCNVYDTVEVGIDTMPPDVDAGDDQVIGCMGDSVVFTLTSNASLANILWTTSNGTIDGPANRQSVTVTEIGTYIVEVIGQNGCVNYDTVNVTPWDGIEFIIIPSSVVNPCGSAANGSFRVGIVSGNGPIEFSLNGGPYSGNFFFNNLASGSYLITARDRDGCTTTIQFELEGSEGFDNVTVDSVKVNLCDSIDNIAVIGNNFGYNEDLIFWQDDPQAQVRRAVDEPGIYQLIFQNECDTVTIKYNVTSGLTSLIKEEIYTLSNAFTPNGDNINDEFIPNFKIDPADINFTNYRLVIFNRWGNEVFESTDPTQGWDGTIDGEEALSEVYIYRLFIGEISDCQGNRTSFPADVGDVTLVR